MRYVVRWDTGISINEESVATRGDAEYLAWHTRNIWGNSQILTAIDLVWEALAQA